MTDKTMREAFEREAKKTGRFDLQRDAKCPSDYWNTPTQHAWDGFQLAWQSQQAQGEDLYEWASKLTDRLHDLNLHAPMGEVPDWAEINGILTSVAPPAPAAVPEGWMVFPVKAWEFILGLTEIEGCSFDVKNHPFRSGRFWWRSAIREMLTAPQPAETEEKSCD